MLITIDSLQLNILPTEDPTEENKGEIVLRFYVKGVGTEDVMEIRKTVSNLYTTLQLAVDKQLKQFSQICSTSLKKEVCTEQTNMQAQASLKGLSSQLALDIKGQSDMLKNIKIGGDVDSSEFDKIGTLYSRYKDYAQQYTRYAAILQKVTTPAKK